MFKTRKNIEIKKRKNVIEISISSVFVLNSFECELTLQPTLNESNKSQLPKKKMPRDSFFIPVGVRK